MLNHRVNTGIFLVLLFVWAVGAWFFAFHWWVAALLVGLWLFLTAVGSFHVRWNYHVHAKHAQPHSPYVALTFDDGPTPFTLEILDLLKKYRHHATFFLIGKRAAAHADIVRRILAEGHEIGNHTWSHSQGTGFLGTVDLEGEIRQADAVLVEITGSCTQYYRPPFGVTNPALRKAIKATGHTVIGWTVRSLDTVIAKQDAILRRVLHRLRPGKIVLLHDTSAKTVRVVEVLLEEMERMGLRSVTVGELLNKDQ